MFFSNEFVLSSRFNRFDWHTSIKFIHKIDPKIVPLIIWRPTLDIIRAMYRDQPVDNTGNYCTFEDFIKIHCPDGLSNSMYSPNILKKVLEEYFLDFELLNLVEVEKVDIFHSQNERQMFIECFKHRENSAATRPEVSVKKMVYYLRPFLPKTLQKMGRKPFKLLLQALHLIFRS